MQGPGAEELASGTPLSGDRAIAARDDDRLGRTGFAESLAEQVRTGGDGLVIALTGAWGSGKTSLLNLVEERLRAVEGDEPAPIVVRFNPWLFSGTEQLVQHFFVELGANLRGGKPGLDDLGKGLQKYGALLGPLRFVPFAGKYVELAEALAGAAGSALAPEESLEDIRRDLDEKLAEAGRRVVVLVDDIDRLEDDEIKQVMALVRLVGEFRNVVYLLAFDAERVTAVLGGNRGTAEGRRYLEKIVQLSYEVPAIGAGELVALAREGVEAALREARAEVDGDRLDALLADVLDPLLATVRDVRRYVNVLPFAFRLMRDDIDAVDILALEAARLFLPGLYVLLPGAEELLTATAKPGDDAERQRFDDQMTVLVKDLDRPVEARAWIDFVFPAVARRLSGEGVRERELTAWLHARRVAYPGTLLSYFEKRLPTTIVAQSAVGEVAALASIGVVNEESLSGYSDTQFANLLVRLPPVLRQFIEVGGEPGQRESVEGSLAAILNRTAWMARERVLNNREANAVRELSAALVGALPQEVACEAAGRLLDRVHDLRLRRLAVEGIAPAGQAHVGEACGPALRERVREDILSLPRELMLDQIALGSLLEWVAEDDIAQAPRVRQLLMDHEIFVHYLATAPVRRSLPALWAEADSWFDARLASVGEDLEPGPAINTVVRLVAQRTNARRNRES
jgi:hypothetical protein